MEELMIALEEPTNVKSIKYDTETKKWEVTYKNGLDADEMSSDLLIDFLNNG